MTRTAAILIAAIAAATALWFAHHRAVTAAHEQGMAQGRAEVQAQWAGEKQAQLSAANAAMQANQQHREEQAHAINTAQVQREQAAQRDQAAFERLSAERDGLRRNLTTALDTIRSCGAVSSTTADAARERAAAVSAVLAAMERAGADMARAADAHAADSLMLQQAWPK